jgi:TatD DNase family protein
MRLVDTHCHLYLPPLGGRVGAALERARRRGVTRVVAPAYDRASWAALSDLSERREVRVAFGLHPWVADESLSEDELRRRVGDHGAVAIGEIEIGRAHV